jgi:arginine-tRNA-protein transferase
MSDMDSDDFSAMIEETNVNTKVVEYYLRSEIEDKLISFSLIDILDDGVSMVYSIFDPEMEKRGLGNFMILDHIQLVEEFKTDYVYLGYWVKGSSKMDYKKHYKPLQLFKENSWVTSDKSLEKQRLKELSGRQEKLLNQDPIYLPED